MGYRNRDRDRDSNARPSRAGDERPTYDDHGLHGLERREYRGRESYEQQTRGGEGGRSGMFPERRIASDMHERYRSNADEDARGYQNIGWRSGFESADRDRLAWRNGHFNGRDDDEARYRREDAGWDLGAADDYSRTDYGMRDYHRGPRPDNERYGRSYDTYPGTSRRPPYPRHVNRGPRGYKRSDERIYEEVCERLGRDWDVDASDIEVRVENGEVTLSGSVADRQQKFRAEHLADGVWGVSELHNQLRVPRESRAEKQAEPSQPQPAARASNNPQRSS